MNFKAARVAMVESQIRPNGVRNTRLLNAFADIPRESFVPQPLQTLAYAERALRIDSGTAGSAARWLLPPMILAKLLEFAEPEPRDAGLDIGGVTGYSAAILSRLCARVFALEQDEEWTGLTARSLQTAGINGITPGTGPLTSGLPENRPYDVIIVNGAVSGEPHGLCGQLAEGGRLLAVVGNKVTGQAHMFTRTNGAISRRAIFDASAEILPGFEPARGFVF